MRFSTYVLLAAFVLSVTGCPSPESEPETPAQVGPPSGTNFRLIVVDDPALAQAVEQLSGTWSGRTGSGITVTQLAEDALDDAATLDADGVIAPSYMLGRLANAGSIQVDLSPWIDPLAPGWTDLFEFPREHGARWGDSVAAIPFGSPTLVCYYRADLLEQLGAEPPKTWEEFDHLAGLLADREALGETGPSAQEPWQAVAQPRGGAWSGISFLARAASYATHRDNYSTFFNINTMDPLIDGPAFVRALEEMVGIAAETSTDPAVRTPAQVRRLFWAGQCGMAITWPTAVDADIDQAETIGRVGLVELPGSKDVFNVSDGAWEVRRADQSGNVSLRDVAGRSGMVTADCEWPEATVDLLLWLSSAEWSRQVSGASDQTAPWRTSQLITAESWVETPMSSEAVGQYAAVLEETFGSSQGLFAMRIPGRTEYLAALGAAVDRALAGKASPTEALADVAAAWREISDRLGVESQKSAYRKSLGLE